MPGSIWGRRPLSSSVWALLLTPDSSRSNRNCPSRGAPVLTVLGHFTLANPEAAEEVRKALGSVTTHGARKDYPRFVARYLPIVSGAVESAGKMLIEERKKGAGMRWLKENAQAITCLRALWRSGRWTPFWYAHPRRRRPKIFPHSRVWPRRLPRSEQPSLTFVRRICSNSYY
jgi:hypothetical protein